MDHGALCVRHNGSDKQEFAFGRAFTVLSLWHQANLRGVYLLCFERNSEDSQAYARKLCYDKADLHESWMDTLLRRLMLRDPQTERAVEISRNPCCRGLAINGAGWDPDSECASHTLIAAMLLGASGAEDSNGISQVTHFDDFTVGWHVV
jgi:hypothetical protein